jgi:hypothetical protein
VLKTECVSDLVRDHILDQASHQIIRQREFFGTRIEWSGLQKVPVTREVHHIVVVLNV